MQVTVLKSNKSLAYLIAAGALIFFSLHSIQCDVGQNKDNEETSLATTSDTNNGETAGSKPMILTTFEQSKRRSFSLQNVFDWFRRLFWKEASEMTLIGLEDSGKTTLINLIANGEFAQDTAPTVGFSMQRVSVDRVYLKLWDLSGRKRYRSMWPRYCRDVKAIVYMVDAADHEKIDESRKELHNIMASPELAGTPLIILGNKSDKPNALNERELIDRLKLEYIENREVRCLSISCKENRNIDLLLSWLKLKSNAKLVKRVKKG